ncbi:O-antigen ligase family protein [Polaribacter sp.]|uniref:O-antigen ligase family protein n=1 Tax=Polaribacter sp. TaxID=1920175 RepID=UPI003F6B38D5
MFLTSYLLFDNKGGESKQILETSLSILVIPIIFSLLIPSYDFKKKIILKFMKLFLLSSSLYALIVMTFIFLDTETYYYSDWYTNKARTLIEKLPLIGQHPIYASIYSAVSMFFVFYLTPIKRDWVSKRTIYYFLCFTINLIFLILLSSRGVIIAFLFSGFFVFIFKLKKNKHKIYLILLFSIVIVSFFQYNRRMKELINFDTYAKVDSNFSNSYRFQIYKCSYKLLKENYITGYGIDNVQLKLNECYKENNLNEMVDKYNSHNQYLDIFLKTGIIGFSLLLVFFISNYTIANKHKNNLALLILIFYSIVFLTENILVRQSGIILFYFLIIFFNKFNFLNEQNKND